jgi:hypothetical protein
MEKEFVPYELAVKLKELGFDEKCFCNWEESWSPEPEDEIRMVLTTDQTWLRPGWIRAPTFSQVFRWFREKHPYRFYILPCSQHKKYLFEITLPSSIFYSTSENEAYNTYEEAELACLKKLIEIVELKSE